MRRCKVRRLPMGIAVDGGSGFDKWFFDAINEQLALGNELLEIRGGDGSLKAKFAGRAKRQVRSELGGLGK